MYWIRFDMILRRERITRLAVDRLGNWSIILEDGTKIKVGRDWDFSDSKRAVLKSILTSSDRSAISYIDARFDNVVVKKKPV